MLERLRAALPWPLGSSASAVTPLVWCRLISRYCLLLHTRSWPILSGVFLVV